MAKTFLKRLLLVDDEEGIRTVLGIALEDRGYEVFLAANGEQALELFRRHDPAIVLTDIKMPGMDGIELLQRIKNERPETEVIVFTGHGDMELAIRSLKYDATDFITKPVGDEVLEVALDRAWEKIRLKSQLREHTQELERLVEEKTRQLIEAERMAAVGQTVAGLAHAIKNITGGCGGGIYVLEKGLELDNQEYLHKGLQMVKGNVNRIKALSMDLLNFAKPWKPHYTTCDPNLPCREVAELAASRCSECGVKLELEPDPDAQPCLMDYESVHRCLLDLVTNALDACTEKDFTDGGGSIVIRSMYEADCIQYQVEDSGKGMDADTQAQVFKGFFTTKGSKGTGLGLMMTRRIVDGLGGTIEFESKPGKGTLFTMRIPFQAQD